MQVRSIAECSNAIFLTFIKLQFVIKIFVLSNFEWPFYTGFTVVIKRLTHKKESCLKFDKLYLVNMYVSSMAL